MTNITIKIRKIANRKNRKGEHYLRITTSGHGEIRLTSEGYVTKGNARRAANSLRKCDWANAIIIDETKENKK